MPARKTILVVDDEPPVRFLAVRILELAGHLVLSAENAEEVRTIWDRVGRSIDLLVTDVIMPGLSGIDLARELRQTRPDLKILFVTGSVEMSGEIQSLGAETRVIYKPYTVQILRQAVLDIFSSENSDCT
jgi:CheY-like chemotaxis protein